MLSKVVLVVLVAFAVCQTQYSVNFNNYGSGCSASGSSSSAVATDLSAIKSRGFLRCGTSDTDSIFGAISGSDRVGVNAAFCKAVAAAIFGDATKVVFTTVDSTSRWTAIPNNLVDIVAFTSTKTASRVLTYGVRFTPIIFYDYTGVATKKTTGVTTTDQLATKGTAAAPVTVCTPAGSTTGGVIASFGAGKNINVDSTRNLADLYTAFAAGTCQYIADDTTSLTARINTNTDTILTGQNLGSLGLQPLAAFTAAENKALGGIAEVVLNGLFLAEVKGVTKANAAASNDVYTSDVGTVAGISSTFMTDVIKAVGNYGEIYNQFVQSKIPRSGFNNLYTTTGGLHYAYNS